MQRVLSVSYVVSEIRRSTYIRNPAAWDREYAQLSRKCLMRSSENSVKRKFNFAEFTFRALELIEDKTTVLLPNYKLWVNSDFVLYSPRAASTG